MTTSGFVIEPPVLAVIVDSIIDVDCNGNANGAVYITASGGTGPYAYLWSNAAATQDITGLSGGSYSVTVTDGNGCTATASAIVNEPTVMTSAVDSVIDVDCNGNSTGAAYISVSGGTPSYSYSWSNAATTEDVSSLIAGTYSVTITDNNGCSNTLNVTVTEPTAISTSATTIDPVCNGDTTGSIDATVSGGTPGYTYSWNTGDTTEDLTNIGAGSYALTVTDANGCQDTMTFVINEPSAVTGTITTTPDSSGTCDGQAIVVAGGGIPPYTYLWDAAAGNQTTDTASGLCPGTYCVTITDADSCAWESCATVTTFIGTKKLEQTFGFNIYPNPNSGEFMLEITLNEDENAQIRITNTIGDLVMDRQVNGVGKQLIPVSISDAAAGIYLLQLQVGDNNLHRKVVVY